MERTDLTCDETSMLMALLLWPLPAPGLLPIPSAPVLALVTGGGRAPTPMRRLCGSSLPEPALSVRLRSAARAAECTREAPLAQEGRSPAAPSSSGSAAASGAAATAERAADDACEYLLGRSLSLPSSHSSSSAPSASSGSAASLAPIMAERKSHCSSRESSSNPRSSMLSLRRSVFSRASVSTMRRSSLASGLSLSASVPAAIAPPSSSSLA